MAVYREGYKAVELIENSSKRIFPDACDYGAPTKVGDSIWNSLKQLKEWYGVEDTRHKDEFGCTVVVELMDEWAVSDGRKNIKEATERFLVTYVICKKGECKGFDGFASVVKLQ